MEKDYKKQLTLKYKQVQRLFKEYNCYVKEVEKVSEKLKNEEEAQVEEYYINKSKEFLKESEATRDDVKGKLRKFLDELISLVGEITSEETKELEEYKTAQTVIETSSAVFN